MSSKPCPLLRSHCPASSARLLFRLVPLPPTSPLCIQFPQCHQGHFTKYISALGVSQLQSPASSIHKSQCPKQPRVLSQPSPWIMSMLRAHQSPQVMGVCMFPFFLASFVFAHTAPPLDALSPLVYLLNQPKGILLCAVWLSSAYSGYSICSSAL